MGSKKVIVRPVFDNPFLNIVQTPDANSVIRPHDPKNPPNPPDTNGSTPVISKDVTLNPSKKTWHRIYIPRKTIFAPKKLPVIVYYHGGGFVFCNADSTVYDVFCKGLVEKTGAMVISLDYRLAPENRLPAAYEDAMEGLYWIINTDDEWIRDFADFSHCYLTGTSAGGNLAYNAGLRTAVVSKDLEPLKIKGLILHHPFFSSTKRTPSEETLAKDTLLPLYAIDQMFDLSLPKGVDHDHDYCNPFKNSGSKDIDKIKDLGWRILVTGCYDDPLVDAAKDCANNLEAKGLKTVRFFGDGYHAMEVFDSTMSGPLYDVIQDFIFVT